MCTIYRTNSSAPLGHHYSDDGFNTLGYSLFKLYELYEKEGGKRRDFLRKIFKLSKRDLEVALWLKRFLPEDFEALRRGEITMAEAREIYRKARPEMEARGALIEEWRNLVKRIPEFSPLRRFSRL